MSTESQYGSWKSPLSSKLASDSSITIKEIYIDETTPDNLYWSELRPRENGRTIVLSKDVNDASSTAQKWTNDEYNIGNKVHEYGGGSFFMNGGAVYFTNFNDGKWYQQKEKEAPTAITNVPSHRYADGVFSKNFIFCIREDHSTSDADPVNTVVAVNVKSGEEQVIASGFDFYAYPRVSPDGTKLLWMQWNHPNMPWDDTEIWIGEISSDEKNLMQVENKRKVAGEDGVNFMEPRWSADGKLMYISDKTGWWNLYQVGDLVSFESRNVCPMEKEIGAPCWQFGHMSYSPHPKNSELVAITYDGKPSILNITDGSMEKIDSKSYQVATCLFQHGGEANLYMVASNPTKPQCILRYSMETKTLEVVHAPTKPILDEGYISVPRHIKFPVDDGKAHAYGYYYPPTNEDFQAPSGTQPPLLIKIHGGPTSATKMSLNLNIQYFTSRGIAILDVNYRGSTGYGTQYRKALNNNWGVYDIEDASAGALYMSTEGDGGERVNNTQLLIDGGSAGGYTTLAALTFRNVFAAGVSFYGVSDLESLAKDTHKFESRYLDNLIAPYPKRKDIYEARSPIKHLDQFKTPCAFFQGALDKVVPPDQAQLMFDAINKKGLPSAYVLFPDEAHGFKKSENKQKSLDGEFYFYSKMLHFTPADEGIEIPIENLPK